MKEKVRKELSEARSNISDKDREIWNRQVLDNFKDSDFYRDAEHIFSFISFRDEIDTHQAIKEFLEDGKKVYVPITESGVDRMKFTKLKNFDSLVVGHFGILSPKEEDYDFVDHEIADIVMIPGLGYDPKGYRIGYGGGFYDKFLGDLKSEPVKVGYAYEVQLTDVNLPINEYDIPVDYMVTNKGWKKIC